MSTTSGTTTIDLSLRGKVVFITGASSGIGAACAASFARAGARLLLAARRNDRLQMMAPDLRAAGAEDVLTVALDVRDKKQVQAVVDAFPSSWQAIDILVNNAGLSRGLEKVHEGKIDDWEEMIDTNLKGLLYVTRAVVPGMVQRGAGQVVNLGSTAGHMTYPNGAVYCATKAAENRVTEGLREDLLGTPVRVTTVDPGMVETEFSKVRFHGDEGRAAKVYKGLTPLQPEDVADAILWAVTRPTHVNIAQVLLTSVDQANSLLFNRRTS
ncbi:MAG TPA: SDR family NAD(P)-dependent oxidoreductase [Acidobacteriaceae bacterium]|nr:SDR family NAD(P)-dependent oxidoreductase [Acidobacteriaceae bacterium]